MFADVIKKLRRSRGLSQLELASDLGVSQQTVGKWERNASFPDTAMLRQLVNYFGVKPEILLGDRPLSDEFFSEEEIKLIANYRRLNATRKKLVRSLVYQLSVDATPPGADLEIPQVVQSNYQNSGGMNVVNVTGQ